MVSTTRRTASRAALAMITVAATLVTGLVASPAAAVDAVDDRPPSTTNSSLDPAIVDSGSLAPAAVATNFAAGYLINDHVMFNGSAMTEQAIQAFLDAQIGACLNGKCLNVLSVPTSSQVADPMCDAYAGSPSESIARIIYKVQVACGVSAKVILVTLQKEQGLVTKKAPTDTELRKAMGYGCPDTAACDPGFAGVADQIYWGARAFDRYTMPPGTGPGTPFYTNFNWFPVGVPMQIKYHPNAACGSQTVTIRNKATASLYFYTPYTPNASALANLYGTGDSCASYGNRNFWRLFTDWFGSPTVVSIPTATQTRIAGIDRFDTSVQLSQRAYPGGASTVYVAVGTSFPDGLAAAPAAAQVNAPLLLVRPTSVPGNVLAELVRLNPTSIVVVGGPGAVSASVASTLAAAVPTATVSRFEGIDRYATARDIAARGFPSGAPIVFLASGANFPDALAASAAAGHLGGPVLLVPGGATAVDAATRTLIENLGATTIVIAGGTGVVSAQLEADARTIPGVTSLVRRGGINRFETAALLNEWAFTDANAGFIASGFDFPDALSAAAIAGAQGAPLALSNGVCTFVTTLDQFIDYEVTSVTLAGGTGVLGPSVGQYETCG